MVYTPSLIKFPSSWGIKKNILNEKHLYPKYTYGKTFDESYDYDTLFADVFRIDEAVIFVSPPFLNFKQIIQDQLKIVDENGSLYKFNFHRMDRCDISVIRIPENINKIYFYKNDNDFFEVDIKQRCKKFDNKKVVCSMQKNEPIEKIVNWIKYYNTVHDIDGFIIFDNQSTDYTEDFLFDHLTKIFPNISIEVVDWDMPYGVLGPPWDSDWSQHIFLNLCKYNFCYESKIVLNHDLDEYLISEYSIDEIVESMVSQNISSVVYESKNISSYTDNNNKILNNYYYYHPEEVDTEKMTKWMTIPKLDRSCIWSVHNIFGNTVDKTEDFYYAHMWILSSKSHDQKKHCSPKEYRRNLYADGYLIDDILKNNFKKCSDLNL